MTTPTNTEQEASFEIAASAAVDCEQKARQMRKGRNEFARQAYQAVTGFDPQPVSYTDADGTLWELNPYIELRLIQRGVPAWAQDEGTLLTEDS